MHMHALIHLHAHIHAHTHTYIYAVLNISELLPLPGALSPNYTYSVIPATLFPGAGGFG